MSTIMKIKLWKFKRALQPSSQFKKELLGKLEVAWDTKFSPIHRWYHRLWLKWSAISASVMLATATISTGAYAYVSPEVIEGTVLYPIKQKIEFVEERLKRTPEAKARFYLKKINRREAEQVVLERQHKNLERVEKKIRHAEEALEKADKSIDIRQSDLKQRIKQRLEQKRRPLKEKNKKNNRN